MTARGSSADRDATDTVEFWRNRIVSVVATICLCVGVVPIAISMYFSAKEGLYLNVVVDAFMLGGFVLLTLSRNFEYSHRAVGLVGIVYLSGSYFAYSYGPFALGFLILFVVPPLTAVLLPRRRVHLVFALTEITVVLLVAANVRAALVWPWNFEPMMGVLFSTSHVFLCALVTYAVVEVVTGLEAVNDHLVESKEKLRQAWVDTIARLATATEFRDEVTGEHILRIGSYSALLASLYGFDRDESEDIYYASLLHDIGKIATPDDLLKSARVFTEGEHEAFREHTSNGAAMLAGSETPVIQMAERIARYHHERWDGSGYPEGLRREEIPIEARIVAICDNFDALTSVRPYKGEQTVDEALGFIRSKRGEYFDPELVDLFLDHGAEFVAVRNELLLADEGGGTVTDVRRRRAK